MKITTEMTHRSYEIGKKVYTNTLSIKEATEILFQEFEMNKGSATDYINDLIYMLNGDKYTRTMNAYSTRYFLENIKKDFGIEFFNKALQATKHHLEYYNSLGKGNLNSIHKIILDLSS